MAYNNRRSKRQRRSRFVEIDGFSVLKLNNYSLKNGELSVFEAEAKGYSEACSFEKAKSAFQLFLDDIGNGKYAHVIAETVAPENELPMQRSARLWRTICPPDSLSRYEYQEEAERLRLAQEQRAAEEKRAAADAYAEETAKEARRAVKAEARRLTQLARQKERQAAKRLKREASGGEPTRAYGSETDRYRRAHNEQLKLRVQSRKGRRRDFFGAQRSILDGFVTPKVLASLPHLSEEDVERAKSAAVDTEGAPLVDQPASIISGTMRNYQLKGLEWLLYMYDNNLSPILGDEMGLGKTLQTISFLAALKERGMKGPSLVVAPLSVLSSWAGEFRRWCPSMRVVRLHSQDKAERERLRRDVLNDIQSYDVVLTTYEYVVIPEMKRTLASRIYWRVVVLDEGHKIKNETTQISQAVRKIRSEIVLLLTGTPLQNNLGELWALLNYLYPLVFTEKAKAYFEGAFQINQAGVGGAAAATENGSMTSVGGLSIDRDRLGRAHYLLRPLMLRRLKVEVEKLLPLRLETKVMCPLSRMQIFWYKRLLLRDSKLLARMKGGGIAAAAVDVGDPANSGSDWKKLQSLLMQLRKCCNHPFLFPNAEAAAETMDDEDAVWDGRCSESIVTASGKMETLDALLRRLKAKGHRVVVFSQFTRMLDIIDDYLNMRGYQFARLDGSTNRVQRMVHIHEFNKPTSPYFCFIMSTRAGGMGINLQTADTVILMDSDWNPQVDMQAMARVHRIGQKKIVHVYRLVSQGTMEERVVQRAQKKLFLDAMVNRGSTAGGLEADKMDAKGVFETLSFGMDRVFGKTNVQERLSEADIDRIIDRSRTDPDVAELQCSGVQQTAASFDETSPLVALRQFGGQHYDKGTSSVKSIADAWIEEVKGSHVRQRKERFTQIDGHTVLKQNVYTMKEGEPSVFESEAKEKAGSANTGAQFVVHGRQVAGRDYDHQSHCQACLDGGELVTCDYCPCTYHLKCVGLTLSQVSTMGWACPHHACVQCGRKAAAVGGLVFRCEMCPKSYCEDHLPDYARDHITNTCPRFQALGQRHPAQACFMVCSSECTRYHGLTEGGTKIDNIYQQTKEGALQGQQPVVPPSAQKPKPKVTIKKKKKRRKRRKRRKTVPPRKTSSGSPCFAVGQAVEAIWDHGLTKEYPGYWPATVKSRQPCPLTLGVTGGGIAYTYTLTYADGSVSVDVLGHEMRLPGNVAAAGTRRPRAAHGRKPDVHTLSSHEDGEDAEEWETESSEEEPPPPPKKPVAKALPRPAVRTEERLQVSCQDTHLPDIWFPRRDLPRECRRIDDQDDSILYESPEATTTPTSIWEEMQNWPSQVVHRNIIRPRDWLRTLVKVNRPFFRRLNQNSYFEVGTPLRLPKGTFRRNGPTAAGLARKMPAQPDDWSRVAIHCHTTNASLQRRMVAAARSKAHPMQLRHIDGGFEQRLRAAPEGLVAALHTILFHRRAGAAGARAEIGEWNGVAAERCAGGKREAGAMGEMKLLLGELYLRLVRELQMQGNAKIIGSPHLRRLLHILGLRKWRTNGDMLDAEDGDTTWSAAGWELLNARGSNLPSKANLTVTAELVALFLAFPGGGPLQCMGPSFFSKGLRPLLSVSEESAQVAAWAAKSEKQRVRAGKAQQRRQSAAATAAKKAKSVAAAAQKRLILQLHLLSVRGWSFEGLRVTRGQKAGQVTLKFSGPHGRKPSPDFRPLLDELVADGVDLKAPAKSAKVAAKTQSAQKRLLEALGLDPELHWRVDDTPSEVINVRGYPAGWAP